MHTNIFMDLELNNYKLMCFIDLKLGILWDSKTPFELWLIMEKNGVTNFLKTIFRKILWNEPQHED